MRISNNMILEVVLVLVGILLALIFLDMSELYWKSDAYWLVQLTLSFIVSSLIFGAIGMILERNSRTGGIFVLAVFLSIAYVLSARGFLLSTYSIYGFILGMLEGGYLSFYSYFNNRFDHLAVYSRRFVTYFCVLTSLYLVFINLEYFQEISQFSTGDTNKLFETIIMIGSLVALSFLLRMVIRGIRAYDVFIYGPSGSGKSLLLLAIYKQFISFYSGKRDEFILSEENKESLKIESMLIALENGELPKSNLRTDLAMYKLSGKNRLKPVGITFVDYGGEHTDNFDKSRYKETIEGLRKLFYSDASYLKKILESAGATSEVDEILRQYVGTPKLNKILGDTDASEIKKIYGNDNARRTEKDIMKSKKRLISLLDKKLDGLEKKIGDLDGIQDLQEYHQNEFVEYVDKIIFACIYKRFESAGKIIFLVDGDYVVDFHKDNNNGKNHLIKLFSNYADIINKLGNEKSYAIVVTKTDKFENLSNILENSNEAKAIEHKIFDMFCEIPTFKEIVHMANRTPIYLYTVSVDATMEPHIKDEDTETPQKSLKIYPWRVGEIEKFSF